jgi:translocation and assembly module TamA
MEPARARTPAIGVGRLRGAAGAVAFGLAIGLAPLSAPGAAAEGALKVEVSGLSGEQEKNVLAFLSMERERESAHLLESRLRRLHAQAPDEIRRALEPFGLYRVEVESVLEQTAEGAWTARYRVALGAPVPVGLVDVRVTGEGAEVLEFPPTGLASGEPFSHTGYESAKGALRKFAVDRGFLDARYESSRVVVDPEAYRADVSLHLDTGPRYYFGEVTFGPGPLDADFLARYVAFKPGDPYRFADLISLQAALYNTDYFSLVEVTPQRERIQDQRVPIAVRVEPNKPNRYRFGVGYATDTGPRVSLDWTRRYLGSRGHSAVAGLSVSPAFQKLEASYRIPLAEPRREFLSLDALAENYDTASREGYLVSLGARHIDFRGDWQRTLGLQYDYESPQGTSEDPFYTLVPSVAWVWKVQDDPVYTTRGFRLDLRALGAAKAVLSSSNFLQGHVRAKGIYTPFERFRVIGRGEVGATVAEYVQDVPPSRRFYAGGDNSVRGYEYEELSPEDEDGDPSGGKNLITASLEVDRRVSEKWAVAAFYDAGSAFNDFADYELFSGAGLGVRWLSPVGLVRVDLAKALDQDAYRLHFVIGPDL